MHPEEAFSSFFAGLAGGPFFWFLVSLLCVLKKNEESLDNARSIEVFA